MEMEYALSVARSRARSDALFKSTQVQHPGPWLSTGSTSSFIQGWQSPPPGSPPLYSSIRTVGSMRCVDEFLVGFLSALILIRREVHYRGARSGYHGLCEVPFE